MKTRRTLTVGAILFSILIAITPIKETRAAGIITLDNLPEYNGAAYVELNNNTPDFSVKMISDAKKSTAYESYGKLDKLGRCSSCVSLIDQSIMPTEKRGEIGKVKPTGWHTVKYNDIIDGNYLYNRCHLIAYCLTGENANKKNLITGTRYMNVEGMLPFEEKVAKYLDKNANNKVLYRVTPIFTDNNLVANGVTMEAMSINDGGKSICFNVYCYNVQPGIDIDYKTGDSKRLDDITTAVNTVDNKKKTKIETVEAVPQQKTVVNTGNENIAYLSATGSKYHSIDHCGKMNPDKAKKTTVSEAEAAGYEKCSKCW